MTACGICGKSAQNITLDYALIVLIKNNLRGRLTAHQQDLGLRPGLASMNNSYLNRYGVSAVVTEITVDEENDRALV